MIGSPETRQIAMKTRYGSWAGNPSGQAFNAARCAMEVSVGPKSYLFCQCLRKPIAGPDLLYCKRHAKSFEVK